MNKNKILKTSVCLLVSMVLVVGLIVASIPNAAAKEKGEVKMKVFVHYPKVDGNEGRPQKPTCQITTNDQVGDYGLTGWQMPSGVASYQINYSSRPLNLSLDNAKSAVNNAFLTWVTTTTPGFAEGTPTTISRYQLDGVNLVAWGTVPSGAIAVTHTWYYSGTGQWVESDTILSKKLKWAWAPYIGDCSGTAGAYDIQNIMTHENGHWLGLNDLYSATDKDLTMYGYGMTGELKKDTLGLGDILGINTIY